MDLSHPQHLSILMLFLDEEWVHDPSCETVTLTSPTMGTLTITASDSREEFVIVVHSLDTIAGYRVPDDRIKRKSAILPSAMPPHEIGARVSRTILKTIAATNATNRQIVTGHIGSLRTKYTHDHNLWTSFTTALAHADVPFRQEETSNHLTISTTHGAEINAHIDLLAGEWIAARGLSAEHLPYREKIGISINDSFGLPTELAVRKVLELRALS